MRPPSVDALAHSIEGAGLPWPLLVDAARGAIAAGEIASARERADQVQRSLLRPVVNATGVLLHTNLGRAPWPGPAETAYRNLELDLANGGRGDRNAVIGQLVARAVGAERAIVVNNGAAAVLLALRVAAAGTGVAVSRGELVEIGGGFRIPEVLGECGAALVEVGTTNRTHLHDYRRVIERAEPPIGAVLKVHRSNFVMSGFTEEASTSELAQLAPPLVVDLGSGLLDEACPWLTEGPPPWLAGEPGVRQALEAGAALATFSGDKLLGGPQAGIIAGRGDLVARCAHHPLARALRPGGAVLAGLQALLLAYLGRDGQQVPLWRMATEPVESLRARGHAVAGQAGLPAKSVQSTRAVMGGGTLPGREIPSAGIVVPGDHRVVLRAQDPPVVASIRAGATVCDLRTVDPVGGGEGDRHLATALAALRP